MLTKLNTEHIWLWKESCHCSEYDIVIHALHLLFLSSVFFIFLLHNRTKVFLSLASRHKYLRTIWSTKYVGGFSSTSLSLFSHNHQRFSSKYNKKCLQIWWRGGIHPSHSTPTLQNARKSALVTGNEIFAGVPFWTFIPLIVFSEFPSRHFPLQL